MSQHKVLKYIDILTDKTIVLSILIASIMLLIFVADLQFTTELYIGVLYVIVVMLSLWLPNTGYTFAFAIISTCLTIFGYFYSIYNISPLTYFHLANFINLSMTVTVIWITTIIAMYIKGMSIALRKSEIIDKSILNTSIDPIVIIDREGVIESASNTLEKTFGWSAEEIKGKKFSTLLGHKFKDQYTQLLLDESNVLHSSVIGCTQEATGVHRMHREFPCELSINFIDIPEVKESFFTAVLRDISVRKAYEDKLGWMSSHDELTKIYNRRYFNEQVEREWRRLLRNREFLAIIILDVDYFKLYNDSLGHLAGDSCLQKIAACMDESSRRASDIVARYGGEEFIVLLPATDIKGAEQVAASIKEKIASLNIIHPNSSVAKTVTVSMGVAAMIPLMGCSYERLIRFADQALYEAKQSGRNKFCLHEE